MWMNDVEMAIDAYRVWLETQIEAELKFLPIHRCPCFQEALEAFNAIFKAGEEDAQ